MSYGQGATPVGYVNVGTFVSGEQQDAVVDARTVVKYGPGGTTSDGSISLSALGEIDVLKGGYFMFKSRLRAGRVGASGTSELFLWAEASTDNGATWNVIGNSVDVSLDSSKEVDIFFDTALEYFPAGVKLRSVFARSGDGDNSGSLFVGTVSAGLAALGVQDAPSAQITIYKA